MEKNTAEGQEKVKDKLLAYLNSRWEDNTRWNDEMSLNDEHVHIKLSLILEKVRMPSLSETRDEACERDRFERHQRSRQ